MKIGLIFCSSVYAENVQFNDPLDNLSLISQFSNNISIDSSNGSYFNHDTGRIKHNTNTVEYVAYNIGSDVSQVAMMVTP